jgi:hypothetical protein
MNGDIGFAAGDVYRFLETHGPATHGQIKKATGHNDAVVNQALGWLAREDNVTAEMQGRATLWRLTRRG